MTAARGRAFRLGAVGFACAWVLAGCVAVGEHEAAVARSRALEHDLSRKATHVTELQRRNAALLDLSSRVEAARGSLERERIELLEELEDLRLDQQRASGELERERRLRQRRELEIEELSGTYRNLVEELESEIESGKIEIHRLRGRLQVRALDRILFDSGSAAIKPEGAEVLEKLGAQLAGIGGHRVRVQGHTDDVPISTESFPSNWELSAARAARVARFLSEAGLPGPRLSAEGHGPHQPIDSNETSEGRARNRRIEIVLVPDPPE